MTNLYKKLMASQIKAYESGHMMHGYDQYFGASEIRHI